MNAGILIWTRSQKTQWAEDSDIFETFRKYVIYSKYSIFMKHFKSSTSVVVEVSAQQFFVHLQFCQFVFLHKTKVNALKHREALNTLLLKSTNTTTLLQYSCGRERRGVVLGLCNDMNALAHDFQLECVGKMCQVICH